MIDRGIENTTVSQGETAELKCQLSREKDAIIYWFVGNDRYNCTASSEEEVKGNGCYTSGSTSHLLVRDTKSLAVGEHKIQCVVEQNLPPDFVNDASFNDSFNSVSSKNGTLTVTPGMSVSTSPTRSTNYDYYPSQTESVESEGLSLAASAGIGGGLALLLLVPCGVAVVALIFVLVRKKSEPEPPEPTEHPEPCEPREK